MKKRIAKAAAAVMATAMLSTALVGCNSSGTDGTSSAASGTDTPNTASTTDGATGGNTDEAVTISWYYPDDLNDHTKVVWDAINTYSQEKINTTVDYHVISWGDYTDKTNTIKTSGQEFDLMFNNAAYFSSVALGVAQPIEDLLKTVGKETWETLPDFLWTASTVNGHIYGVPTYKDCAACPGLVYNKTLAEDLGITVPETYGGMMELNDLFYDAKAKRDAKYPEDKDIPILTEIQYMGVAADTVSGTNFAATAVPGIDCFTGLGNGEKVFNVYGTPEYLAEKKMTRKWVEDGIYPLDQANYDTERTVQNSGKILFRAALGYVSFPENGWSDDVKTGFVASNWRFISTDYAMFGTNIVGAKSQHPDRAVAFLNLVNTDNFVANTLRFGTEEGGYFTKTADNRLDFTTGLNSDPANRAYYKWYGWQFGNLFAMSLPAQESDTLWEDLQYANENAHVSDNMGFVFDQTPVINEIAACNAVKEEYDPNLGAGMTPDVDKAISDFNAKLAASGVDKIVAEAQKQLNEWRAANGKTVAE